MNILIIDDDSSLRYMLTEICHHAKWTPTTAENGNVGLDLFRQYTYDVILIDYHMPELDGLQTVKAMRKLNDMIPILVLTVDERQEVADQFLENGATDFALKPVKAPDIISRIQLHAQLANMQKVKNQEAFYPSKGISSQTLQHISTHLKAHPHPIAVDELSKHVNLAYPTVYRYLLYLLEQGKVKQVLSHQKVGRPKKLYQWYA
ncbi:response regulator [Pontibacillus litoralis]|uniref:Response regulator n=1 Tax=Pontibacillus litoralis JSM 072002 TaxID=1385512 RepID=A0A0A5G268_9BACI|nr:response regulator [Pontibacillus litoralis]KGX86124.1 response regulator [Pontibacillus litoralis JSM 072002]